MADFFFFTEPSKLIDQTQPQAFGALDENQFRIGNMFSISSDARAFAFTDGLLLVQQIGTTDKYNIILKPSAQPDLNLPKISYVIYKGIKESSIISGDKVAAATNNDLTRIIHTSAEQWYAADGLPVPSTEPAANTSLGLEYSATNPDPDFAIQNTDTLDRVFYSSNALTLPFVFGGNYIGDFDSSGEIGFTILFEKIGYRPTFKIARELNSVLAFDPLGASPTEAEVFALKNNKESVLSFMDSSAFFGAFNGLGLRVFDGSAFVNKNADDLFNDVVSKHYHKNTVYLDIRNESDDSFNYFENYGETIGLGLDNSEDFIPVEYNRNNLWPIFSFSDQDSASEFSAANTNKIIKLRMPRGDNEAPLSYYKRAFKNELGFELPSGVDQFFSPVIENEEVTFNDIIPHVTNGRANANYFQLRHIRRVGTNEDPADNFPTQGFSFAQNGYLDGLFPIFDMAIPFDDTTGKSYAKIYYDVAFVDRENINGSQFTANLGIAQDGQLTTFIAYPNKYNLNIRQNNDDEIPLSGFEGPTSSLFLLELDNQIQSIKIVKSEFVINGVAQEYLRFEDQPSSFGQEIENYSFEDVSILALTNQQFQDLVQLRDQEFPVGYKVHLGVENIEVGTDDGGNSFTKFEYVLRGLKEDGNGTIIRHSASPSPAMVVYTNEKIVETEYVRNYEESLGLKEEINASLNLNIPNQNNLNNEDYFIGLQPGIKRIVDDFSIQLNNLKSGPLFFEVLKNLVSVFGKSLWDTATNIVQANTENPNDSSLDDRPLYWARLKMGVLIKQHPYFRPDLEANSQTAPNSELSQTIKILEETSRNYTGVVFSGAASLKKILVVGFDPFFLDRTNSVIGGVSNILHSNPSGIAVLSMHDLNTTNDQAQIQSMIVPVRYPDFDSDSRQNMGDGEGIIETYIGRFVNSADMIITLSRDGAPEDYNIDVYSTKNRGGIVPDNLNFTRVANSNSINDGSEWIATNLPPELTGGIVQFDSTYTIVDGGPLIDGNLTPPDTTQRLIRGSGGNFLSNEIFYRVARLRNMLPEDDRPKTGHFHVSKFQEVNEDLVFSRAFELVNIVKQAINNGATAL